LNYDILNRLGFILLILLGISCATTDRSGLLTEDELVVARKYVGEFMYYRYTSPSDYGWPNTVWIETTQDSVYGKISVYSRGCEFEPGERLYIRRSYESPGVYGYWIYQIENENNIWYKLSEFQNGNNVLAKSFR
jgi:hypothetical protein